MRSHGQLGVPCKRLLGGGGCTLPPLLLCPRRQKEQHEENGSSAAGHPAQPDEAGYHSHEPRCHRCPEHIPLHSHSKLPEKGLAD